MGARLVLPVTVYLDTHIAVWLAQGSFDRITPATLDSLETATLLLSPMVLLELEYLFEVGRIQFAARDLLLKLEHELHVHLCDLPFPQVAQIALNEKWTRDPFDRTIVAQAKANGLAPLVSADDQIRAHYPRTIL